MVLHAGDRSDFRGYVLPPRGTSDLQNDPPWQGTGGIPNGRSVRAQPAPHWAPWTAQVRPMFPRGVGLLQLPTSRMCIYSYPATWMENMFIVLQPRCLRRLRYSFFVGNPALLLALLSVLEGLCGWVLFFSFLLFTFLVFAA